MPAAKDVMTTDVTTIDGMATARQAAQMMSEKGVRALIVDRREPKDAYGIVTQRDIVYEVIAAGEDPDEVLVRDIMSKPLVVVNPDLDVKYVARLMANMGLSRAPVIFEGKVQGIVSVSDVVKTVV
ncbi:MAG: CBS domain-containing protein [Armatimonadetes bacterium]|nr:CBS domain-containing protein [Armatimonadota bacterium]